jgi:hypothetical protein
VCQIRPSILYADYAKTALADLFNMCRRPM